jgi:hypothetical protein
VKSGGTAAKCELALEAAWVHLVDWASLKKFVPRNEEDIQCLLYHGLVLNLGTAVGIRAKATTAKPSKLTFQDGRLSVGDMHYPDLALGEDDINPEVVVEIKYRAATRGTFYGGCKKDIPKLRRLHDGRVHYFVLFDANPDYVFLD